MTIGSTLIGWNDKSLIGLDAMDSVTHTLFGLTLYGATNKTNMSKKEKAALLCCALVASNIPDIDVISALWDFNGQYQMWHRGITHSLFMTPVWALMLALLCRWIFRVRGRFWFYFCWLAVFIHSTSDIFNAWGTGYLEPFSSVRLTFGTTSIIDFVFWFFMVAGFLVARLVRTKWQTHHIYRFVWVLIVVQLVSQAMQGAIIYQQHKADYERLTLVADFVPLQFTIVGQNGNVIEMKYGNLVSGFRNTERLVSNENVNKKLLFEKNPRAKTLVEWAPIVVFAEDERKIAVFDPRFYRQGGSFLTEEYLKEKDVD